MCRQKTITVNPWISPLRAYLFLDFAWEHLKGVHLSGDFKIFLVVGQVPVEILPLINYFFDDTLTRNGVFFEGQANFC